MVDTTFKAISALAPHKFPGTPKPQACCDCFKSCSACHNQHDLDMAKKFNTLQNWLSLQVKQLEMQKRRHLQCTESKERDSSLPVRKSIKNQTTHHKKFQKVQAELHRTSPFQGPPRSHRFSGNGISLSLWQPNSSIEAYDSYDFIWQPIFSIHSRGAGGRGK